MHYSLNVIELSQKKLSQVCKKKSHVRKKKRKPRARKKPKIEYEFIKACCSWLLLFHQRMPRSQPTTCRRRFDINTLKKFITRHNKYLNKSYSICMKCSCCDKVFSKCTYCEKWRRGDPAKAQTHRQLERHTENCPKFPENMKRCQKPKQSRLGTGPATGALPRFSNTISEICTGPPTTTPANQLDASEPSSCPPNLVPRKANWKFRFFIQQQEDGPPIVTTVH